MGVASTADGSPKVFYASACGVRFDGSDESARVQALLDHGQAGPIKVVLDGSFKAKGLKIYSGTTVEGLGNGTVVTQATSTSVDDGNIFRNANWRSPYQGATIVDSNITIRNLYLEGNSRNGSSGSADRRLAPDNSYCNPIKICGCNGVVIENVYIYDPCSLAIMMANVFGVTVANITAIDPYTVANTTASTGRNTNLLQIMGPAADIAIRDLYGYSDDDFLALNACDGHMRGWPSNPGFGDSWGGAHGFAVVYYGDIVRVRATGLYPRGCANVVRLLAGTPGTLPQARVADVIVSGVVAKSKTHHFLTGSFADGYGSTGLGLYERVIFRDWTLGKFGESGGWFGSTVGSTITSLTLAGWKLSDRQIDGPGAIYLDADANVAQLKLADWTIREDAAAVTPRPIVAMSQGTIDELVLDGVNWSRNAASATAAVAISGGTVNRVELADVSVNNVNNVVAVSGGTVGGIVSTGLVHRGAGGGHGSIDLASGVTLPRLRAAGSDTAQLVTGTGTITSRKTDATEDA